jgi:hypothetical protein
MWQGKGGRNHPLDSRKVTVDGTTHARKRTENLTVESRVSAFSLFPFDEQERLHGRLDDDRSLISSFRSLPFFLNLIMWRGL